MKSLVVCLFVLSLAACATPPPAADQASDRAGKQFGAPAAGRAALYVSNASSAPMEVSAGQRSLGVVGRDMWLRADLPAGDYDIRCKAAGYSFMHDSLRVSLRPGDTTFVTLRFVALSDVPCRAALQDAAAGRAAVLAGQRAREISGASD